MSDTNQMDDKPELGCITKLFDEAPTVEPGVTGRLHYDKASHTIRGDKSIEYDDPIHDAIGTLPYLLSMLRQKEPPSEWDEKNVWQLQRDLRAYYDTIQSRLALAEAAIDAVIKHAHQGYPASIDCQCDIYGHTSDERTLYGIERGHRCAAIPCNEYRAKWPKEE